MTAPGDPLGDVFDDPAADLTAEPDTSDPGDTTDDGRNHAIGDPGDVTATCSGGPYHGRVVISRFPKGFLLVARSATWAWLYDYEPGAHWYTCRDATGMPLNEPARLRAAEEGSYDVVAFNDDPAAAAEVHA